MFARASRSDGRRKPAAIAFGALEGGLLDATWSFERGLDGEVRMVVRGDLDIADEERLVREIDEHFERNDSDDRSSSISVRSTSSTRAPCGPSSAPAGHTDRAS